MELQEQQTEVVEVVLEVGVVGDLLVQVHKINKVRVEMAVQV